ncbi:MAG: hypothetical protein PF542_02110 [Nanoarchaeota archaeon]|jgi:hypothetical protein|nr:hypothetical protein [Nanoarchaeota archaeon]
MKSVAIVLLLCALPLVSSEVTFFQKNFEGGYVVPGDIETRGIEIFCGDNVCGATENCSSCEVDCGSCRTISGQVTSEDEGVSNIGFYEKVKNNKGILYGFFGLIFLVLLYILFKGKIRRKNK